ncbi:MAG: hypothetical protein WC142_06680 [Bacteroidales bacterium]|nr:hypothetical protein [Bacteroidales bacterium]MDD2687468.1 hypothetical protein [Bacteroidales bacterium]MDD3330730.1 hypothetical protein [Bacteroidales bacterium]MDD3691887.1 hypothetical protein [Bacteroidales bacterium]MDD4045062.1 hypothetical protein [Bacteroidales bacterium]
MRSGEQLHIDTYELIFVPKQCNAYGMPVIVLLVVLALFLPTDF